MPNDPLPVAVVGAGAAGRLMLEALSASSLAEIVGVSDKDPKRAERMGAEADVQFFSDNRHLLSQARPAAVFVATPPSAGPDLLAACAERGIHVWKELPLARDLSEGLAMVQRMEEASLKLVVGTQRRFAAGYRQALQLRARLKQVFLARAHYMFNWGPELGWRGDSASGGGALLDMGYHPVDLLVWLLGLPDEVYGFSAGGHRPEPLAGEQAEAQPLYDTDDTAAAMLRYGDGCAATIVTTRSSGPLGEQLSLHGRAGSIQADAERCLLFDPDGNVLESPPVQAHPLDPVIRQAEAFIRAITGKSDLYECSGRENLLNLVVIEAIYLSSRTGQPESPPHLLKQHDLTAEDCLRLRPASASPWHYSDHYPVPSVEP